MWNNCGLISILFSLVISILATILYFFGNLPLIFIPVAISLLIAIIMLILLTVLLTKKDYRIQICLNSVLGQIIFSILGTIAFSMIYLSRLLIPISIINSILIFFNAFFFALMMISFAMFIYCLRIHCINQISTSENEKV